MASPKRSGGVIACSSAFTSTARCIKAGRIACSSRLACAGTSRIRGCIACRSAFTGTA